MKIKHDKVKGIYHICDDNAKELSDFKEYQITSITETNVYEGCFTATITTQKGMFRIAIAKYPNGKWDTIIAPIKEKENKNPSLL